MPYEMQPGGYEALVFRMPCGCEALKEARALLKQREVELFRATSDRDDALARRDELSTRAVKAERRARELVLALRQLIARGHDPSGELEKALEEWEGGKSC